MTKRLLLLLMLAMLTFFIGVAADRLVSIGKGRDFVPVVKQDGPALPAPLCAPEFTAPLPVSVASPTPIVILDYNPKKFDPTADYSFIGATPAKFREVPSFSLLVDRSVGEQPWVEAYIYTESEEFTPIVFALITEKRLFFVTAPSPSTGIEYRFDGQYLRTDIALDSAEGKVAVKGILTKSQNGRRLAESVVKFQVMHSHC